MAQTVQIVPEYSFPYVATYINDYSIVADDEPVTSANPVITYAYAFRSGKGIANTFVKRTSTADFTATFGESNFAKYGQPLMTVSDLLKSDGITQGNVEAWCMRVMPENAEFANAVVYIGYKADERYTIISDTTETTGPVNNGDESTTTDEDGTEYTTYTQTTTTVRTVVVEDSTGESHTYVETTEIVETILTTVIMSTDESDSDAIYVDAQTDDGTTVDDGGSTGNSGTTEVVGTTTTVSYTEDGGDAIEGSIPTVITSASACKFRVKFTAKSIASVSSASELAGYLDGSVTIDGDGYTTLPLLYMISSGPGVYGNDYGIRITQSTAYDTDYNMKVLCFSILNTNGGVTTDAQYMGSLVDTSRYTEIIQIEDIIDASATGIAPVQIVIDQESISKVYDAYKSFCESQFDNIVDEYNTAYEGYIEALGGEDSAAADILEKLLSGMYTFNERNYSEYAEAYTTLSTLQDLIEQIDPNNMIELDQFDPITGTQLGSTGMLPLFEHTVFYDGNLDDADIDEYDKRSYTTDASTVDFTSTLGVALSGGTDGDFDTDDEDALNDTIEYCYNSAFNGTFDPRILTAKRIYVDAFFDANYPVSVKHTLADLAITRKDAMVFLDTGIIESLSKWQVQQLINEYSEYSDSYFVSKNLHHYYVRESTTNKKVCVTITHFLAQQWAYHMLKIGQHIPFVKKYAQLTGHVKDSLAPTIEDYQKELKDTLNLNRFNYFEIVSDNVFQRATQNTAQEINSDLLEESNINTLLEMKRIVEADCDDHLYDFLDETTRNEFRTYELAKFNDWIGTKLEAFDIRFECNEYEFNHSILHCYIDITFRGLIKFVTIEIDVNKREYNADTDEE